MEDLSTILNRLKEEFATKERLSQEQTWCTPIPFVKKVSTVREFYTAFHDVKMLPIHTCMICYGKYARVKLEDVNWEQRITNSVGKQSISLFRCSSCFPIGKYIPGCRECVRYLGRGERF